MPSRRKFYIFKRTTKKGMKYWYVNYVDPETGAKNTVRSIDVLKEKLGLGYADSINNETDAIIIANKALEEGLIFERAGAVYFVDYCKAFWDFENSDYIRMRNYIKPNSIGKEYCMNMLINFNKHVVPFLPKKLRIQDVKTIHLDKVVKNLLFEDKLSTGTIQCVVLSFNLPLKEAYRQGLINVNPSDRLMKIPNNENPRGVLDYKECVEFAKTATAMYKAGDLRASYYLALITALSTGMRSGEIRALHSENIISNALVRDDGVVLDRIIVKESIAPYTGLKGTKGKYERELCVPHELGELLKKNANDKGIVFPSIHGSYMTSPTLREVFKKVMIKMGVSITEQKERNLSFHSLRHSYNTYSFDSNLPAEERMLVLGHKSEKVNDRYTHITDTQLKQVSKITSEIVAMF